MSTTRVETPVLEPAAQAFAEATANPPYLFELPVADGRKAVDEVQSGEIAKPPVDEEWVNVEGGPTGEVRVRIVKPRGTTGTLPVIVYLHGAGWVFGDAFTHDRLVRELAVGVGAAVVFPEYSRSPEARYPIAIEQNYTVAQLGRGERGGQGPRHEPYRRGRRLGRRQHVGRADADGEGARRTEPCRAGALLPGHRRQLRHRLLPPVRRGLLPPPRRHAVVLGPVHDGRGAAKRDHRLAAACRASSSSRDCRRRS